jgi:hypothetical protein
MSALDQLAEDGDFQSFRDVLLDLNANVENPEQVRDRLDEDEDIEAALEDVDLDADEVEHQLEVLHVVANDLYEKHPELLEQVEAELNDSD